MFDNLIPLLSFVLITNFTPGPNNISSASMGVLHGYKNTLRYLMGISVGFFFMMLFSAFITTSLLSFMPTFEPILRIIGAGYILYLALGTLKASYTFKEHSAKPMGFMNGLMLQLLNPKVIVYGLTLFSAFLVSITHNMMMLVFVTVLLALVAFCAVSTWTLFGTAIKTHLHHPWVKVGVNTILAFLLVYTAIDLAGFI